MSSAVLPPPAPVSVPTTARMTPEEFVARHNGDRLELVNGILQEPRMPGLNHGMICQNVAGYLWTFVREKALGRVMSNDSFVRTGPETVRGADVLFYSYERLPREQPVPTGFHNVAPDLIVEVKSPSDLWVEVFTKIIEYLRSGVRVVVLVDPAKSLVSVYQGDEQNVFRAEDTLTLPDVLPGFAVAVHRLFE